MKWRQCECENEKYFRDDVQVSHLLFFSKRISQSHITKCKKLLAKVIDFIKLSFYTDITLYIIQKNNYQFKKFLTHWNYHLCYDFSAETLSNPRRENSNENSGLHEKRVCGKIEIPKIITISYHFIASNPQTKFWRGVEHRLEEQITWKFTKV